MSSWISTGIKCTWNAAEILAIVSPDDDVDANKIDATIQANQGMKSWIRGLPTGTLALEIWWDQTDTVHQALYADMASKTSRTLVLGSAGGTFPDSTSYTVTAFIKHIGPEEKVGDGRKATVEFQVTGVPAGADFGTGGTPT